MEKSQQELQERFLKVQKDSQEQIAKLMKVIMAMSLGKGVVETSNVKEVASSRENIKEESSYPPSFTPQYIHQIMSSQLVPSINLFTYAFFTSETSFRAGSLCFKSWDRPYGPFGGP